MNWITLPDKFPDDGESVMLKIHVTSIGNFVDKEKIAIAVYKERKWFIDGEELVENDYPIMRKPIAWSKK